MEDVLEKKKVRESAKNTGKFVVSIFSASSRATALWSKVWSSKTPMGLGYPFNWVLEKADEGFRFRKIGQPPDQVIEKPVISVSIDQLNKPIALDGMLIRITPVFQMAAGAGSVEYIPDPISTSVDFADQGQFRKTLTATAVLTVVFGVVLHFLPEKKESEELIPPQFAKVLLTPQVKTKEQMDARSAKEKTNENNVVKAFRSDAVQKSAKNLLGGGAARNLLSKSKLLDTAGANAAVKDVFGQKSNLVGALKVAQGNTLDPKASKVGLLGGAGGGSGGVGYGSATAGSVSGQGGAGIGFSTEGLDVDEGLTKDEVGLVIRQHVSEIRYCYEAAMVRNPGFEGKFVAAFVITAEGIVKTAKAKEPSGDNGLDTCIISRLLKWKFPKPRKGVEVSVSYPFIFKSLSN